MADDKPDRPVFEGQLVTKGYGQGDTQLIGVLVLLTLYAITLLLALGMAIL